MESESLRPRSESPLSRSPADGDGSLVILETPRTARQSRTPAVQPECANHEPLDTSRFHSDLGKRLLDRVPRSIIGERGFRGIHLFQVGYDDPRGPVLVLRETIGKPPRARVLRCPDPALEELQRCFREPTLVGSSNRGLSLQKVLAARRCGGDTLLVCIERAGRLWGCAMADAAPNTPADTSDHLLASFSMLAGLVAADIENMDLRAEAELRISAVSSLQAVGAALVQERNLDCILTVVINEACRLLNAKDALVLLLEEDESQFLVRARTGPDLPKVLSSRMPVGRSLNGLVARTGRPLVSNDAMTDPRADQVRARALKVKSVAIAPLRLPGVVLGTLAVHNKVGGLFVQADVDLLSWFADQAAIAIDNAKLLSALLSAKAEIDQRVEQLQELLTDNTSVQEAERRWISSDLHDTVVPRILAALYALENCLYLEERSQPLGRELLRLRDLLNSAVEQVRASIYHMWPISLEHMGLLPALRELFREEEQRSALRCHLRVIGDPFELPPTSRIAVYRIVQEALCNVRKHAQADVVTLTATFGSADVRVVVTDNGRGFESPEGPTPTSTGRLGLIGMAERARSVGGALSVKSARGRGTRVALSIPTTAT